MTDTAQDLSAPPVAADPVPAPTDPTPQLSQRGRPSRVIERDLSVARVLAEGERSKHEVMAVLGLEWRVTYNSLCRLRDQGLVKLNRNGTRTPTWGVTEKGHEWLGTPPLAPEPSAEAPEPGAEPVPIAPPPPPEPEPAPVAEVPQSPTTPEPEQPGTVAPSPGPAEPVWPI